MHHAYPRECPYPHLSGAVRSQSTTSLLETSVVKRDDMSDIIEKHKAEQAESALESSDECTTWSDHEELYVTGDAFGLEGSARTSASEGALRLVRPVAYFAVLASVARVLVQQVVSGSR